MQQSVSGQLGVCHQRLSLRRQDVNVITVGTYLFSRISSDDGKDSRFDEIRQSPPKFFVAFFAQATWVSLCLLPIIGLNSLPTTAFKALPAVTATDLAGVALFVGGFLFEVTADMQKNKWVQEKKEKKHSEEFLTRGLWSKSRHPNSTLR